MISPNWTRRSSSCLTASMEPAAACTLRQLALVWSARARVEVARLSPATITRSSRAQLPACSPGHPALPVTSKKNILRVFNYNQ